MTLRIKSLEEYQRVYAESVRDPEGFWAQQADSFLWRKKWDNVLSWNFKDPNVRWFEGAQLNITENCLDRHLAEKGDQTAILWEANDPNQPSQSISYQELYERVCQCANGLKELGIHKGDRIVFYMPMVPELAIAVLACARIGAVHSVVFAGFSAQALADRVNDAQARVIICSDYNNRGAKNIAVKEVVDQALSLGCPSVEKVLVHKNTGGPIDVHDRDIY